MILHHMWPLPKMEGEVNMKKLEECYVITCLCGHFASLYSNIAGNATVTNIMHK